MRLNQLGVGALVLASSSYALAADATKADAKAEPSAISRKQLSVIGTNDEWSATETKVAAGDVVILLVSGKVTYGGFIGAFGPAGTVDKAQGLEMKVGSAGVPFLTGERFAWVADAPGAVKLRARDSKHLDNSGKYEVEIIHIPASLLPEATTVVQE